MGGVLPIIILLVMLLLGIMYCFWGYKYLKIFMFIFAFFMGAYYSYTLIGTYVPNVENWLWLISIIIGVIFALLAFFFVKFALFVAGGLIGLMIFDFLRGSFPAAFETMEPLVLFLIGLGLFIVFGAITLASKRLFVILFSAAYGAYTIVTTVGIMIGVFFNTSILSAVTPGNFRETFNAVSVFNQTPSWMLIVPVIVFAVAGIIAQYKFTAPNKGK